MTTTTHRPPTTFSAIFQWRSLKTRVIIFTLSIFLIGIWSLAFYGGQMLHKDMEHLLGEQQFSTVSFIAAEVNAEFGARVEALKTIAKRITPAMISNPKNLQTLLEDQPIFYLLFNNGVAVGGLDGTVIAEFPPLPGRLGANFMERDYIIGPLKEGKVTIGRPVMSKLMHAPAFVIAVPIRDAQEKVIGVIAGVTDLRLPNFLDKVTESRYGKTGGYQLIAPQHKLIVTGTDKSRIMQPIAAPGINPLFDRYLQGFEGSGVVVDSRGLEVLLSAKQIPMAGWFIVARMPTEEAFAPVHALQKRVLLATIFLTLLLGVLTWWMLKRQLAPIFTTIGTLAALSDSDQPSHPLPITREDEIGKLIGGFNHLLETLGKREEALQESEDRQKRMLANISDVIAIMDKDGTLKYKSPNIKKWFGWQPEDLVGTDGWETVHPKDIDRIQKEFFTLLDEDNSVKTVEYRYKCKDGSYKLIELTAVNLTNDPLIHGVLMNYRDITDRRQSEEEVGKERNLIANIMETSPVGITTVDSMGRITFANSKAIAILGLAKDQGSQLTYNAPTWCISALDGKPFPEDRLPFTLVMSTGKAVFDVQHAIQWPDGKRILLSINGAPMIDASGQVNGMVASIDDITVRKQAEENYRTLFREMIDGFALHEIICDEEGLPIDYRFLAVNPAFEHMTGLKAEELVGRTVLDVLPKTERYWIETYGRVALTGEPVLFENYAVELGKHFEVTAFQSAPKQFACIFADITDRKRAEEERAKLEAQLQQAQKMESVGRLAGGVAHDFNNMLGVILGHAEIALDQVDPAQPLHADLQEIRNAANRSADLTRQLLAFARKQVVSPKVLDMNDTISGMLKMLQRLIGEDINLAWLPAAHLWPVNIDPSQLDQILANLCINARDAIAGVGRLTIETENIDFDNIYCTDHPGFTPGEYVLLTVSDDGCGMDRETVDKIFEPFFTTKGIGKGTGLGLATIYGIVKQNSGFINVYSEPDQGTTFKIYLPRHMGKTEQARTEKPQEPIMRGQETILLVEDEPALLELSKLLLSTQGYRVLPAGTPGEAIRLAGENSGEIHLLMTDVVMPGMNGRDLAKKLLALYPHLKCLFTSGYTANVIAHHGVLDEGVHFIQKPFSRGDLAAKVREVLDRE